ncbi:MAG: tRNA 2-thiouridine(34) synthase MnmA [Oscillospiraceae bacterium]|jgi:tRNA-specific 2-thiouridylase|nr:tRNA 2-thiouridine(34) synthase MnmA [Oscillospiraceae bacterium]
MLEPKQKVVLGLSGGVDSAVAARLLQERGFEVFALHLITTQTPSTPPENASPPIPAATPKIASAPPSSAVEDARKTAQALGIPFAAINISRELEEQVCAPFVASYLRGETPNPCIFCNPKVKFKTLIDYADNIGAYYVATGHYARAIDGGLYKAKSLKDQSYMLNRLTPDQVARAIFPLGDLEKTQVRALAENWNLPPANKPDSMEICFIPDGDFGAYIERRGVYFPPGNVVSKTGETLGKHRGVHRYTIGQRRGLGIAAGGRLFVCEIRPGTNEVVLSDGADLLTNEALARDVNWLVPCCEPFEADVKIRHSKTQTPALVTPTPEGAKIAFKTPVRAPTRGQSAVFYVASRLIGGGFID